MKDDREQKHKERIALVSHRPGEALRPRDMPHTEVASRRGRNSKTYDLGGGKHRLIVGKSPVHYWDNGRWQEIDLTVIERHGNVGVDKAPYRLELLTDRVGYTYTSRAGGRVDLELIEVGELPVNYDNLTTSKDGNQFFWDGVAPGLRLKAQLKPQGVEIFKELADDKAPRRFVWRVRQDVDSKCAFQSKSGGYDSAPRGERVMRRLRRLEMVNEESEREIITEDGRAFEQFTYEETWTGRLSTIKDRKTRQKEWTAKAVYPVIIDVLVSEQIAADVDDGYQVWSTTPTTPTTWIYNATVDAIGYVPGTPVSKLDAGFRFTSIPVPQGGTITSAALKFFALAGPISVPALIQADDVDDAPVFSNGNLPRAITPTAASTVFTFPYATTPGWTTANVTGIVQEIVNRPGWTPNNDIRFGIFQQLTGTTNVASVLDYGFYPAQATILEINYSLPSLPGSSQACRAFSILAITDGTTRVNLLNCGRWMLTDWDPVIPGAKGGGTWQDSPLSPGRQLVDYQRANWIDVFTLMLNQPSQDDVIYQEQELLRLLEKAVSYWTSQWQNEPVWIEARAALETNTRYAVIKSYRVPTGSGNPFAQPFILPEPKSIIEDFQLTIEHGPWLSDEPGTGTCVEISGKQNAYPFHLTFDQETSEVNCGSNAALDNLPLADFTAEAWVRLDTCGIANSSYLFNKLDWWLVFDCINNYVQVFGDFTVINMLTIVTTFPFLDGEWHHIAVQSIGPGPLFFVFIDGADAAILSNAAGAGVYDDSAFDFYIGNSVVGTNAFDGDIGWCRISDINRYTVGVPFTPPPRCTLPAVDGNTVAQWIGAEGSGATIDNQEGTAALDGTQTDCEFDSDCEHGRDATCEDEVYIANKHNRAQITNVHYLDIGTGVYSANLIGSALPFAFYPAIPAVGDIVYFGIDIALDDSGPFCSLVFDIGTAIVDVTGIDWEYWNGAGWVALTVQDNTNADGAMTGVAFDTSGVNSVHWEQPSNWATLNFPAIPGAPTLYAVRARVTAIGAAPTAPTQQNRDIYSILWPYVEVAPDQVGGDIGTLVQVRLDNQSDDNFVDPVDAWQNRVIVGARLLSRGSNFTPFINLADEQNPSGITVTPFGVGAFITDAQAATGRALFCTNPAAQAGVAQITLDSSILLEYDGVFHAFIRGEQLGGISGIIEMQMFLYVGGVSIFESQITTFPDGGSFNIADFGQVEIKSIIGGIPVNEIVIELHMSGNGVQDSTLYELVLMPVDEWSCDTITPINSAGIALGGRGDTADDRSYLIIDSITSPKERVFSAAALYATDFITGKWRYISPKAAILQSNAIQRIWFLSSYFDDPANTDQKSTAWIADTVRITGSQMYLYARGAR